MASNTPAAGPSVVEVPLPPGMSMEQFLHIRNQLVIIGIISVVVLAIAVWDYLVLLRHEIRSYRGSSWRGLRKQPTFWAFSVLRYSIFLAKVPPVWFTVEETKYCQALVGVSQAGGVLVTVSAGLIFCYRVAALWKNSLPVRIAAGILYVFMVSSWIASATQFRATTDPTGSLLTISNCKLVTISRWTAISYASSVVFDLFVVLATALKLSEARRQSAFGQQLYADSLFYFAAVSTTNIVVLVVQALPQRYQPFKPMVVPWSILITSTLAQRVYLKLKLFNFHSGSLSEVTFDEGAAAAAHVKPAHLSTHIVISPEDISPSYAMKRFSFTREHLPP